MAKIFLSSDSNPGGRKYNEDRCATAEVATSTGQRLSVAVVCDGVGGAERGERAAQLAVDTVIDYIRLNASDDIPTLLTNAMRAANQAAVNEAYAAREAGRLADNEQMACTMVLGIIVNETTLHIANAGDSRIYLARGGQLQQLTRDHTYENVMVWMGKLSAEAAAASPEAGKVMRVLGTKENLQVDQGIYLTTTDYTEANKLGREGFALRPGDSVVLCTDGLVKDTRTTGEPLISNAEIVKVLGAQEGEAAARGIMSIALGRIPVAEPVDNLTVALMQTEDPKRLANAAQLHAAERQKQLRRALVIAALIAVPILLIAGAVAAYFFNASQQSQALLLTERAEQTQTVEMNTALAELFTPTPTATNTPEPTATPSPIPTLAAGEIAKLFNAGNFERILISDKQFVSIPANSPRFIAINHNPQIKGSANLHLFGGSQVQFDTVSDSGITLRLGQGSDLFFRSGPYPNGADIALREKPEVTFRVQGCLALTYRAADIVADCFQGTCQYSTDFGATFQALAKGQQITLDAVQLTAGEAIYISRDEMTKYWNLLKLTSAGHQEDAPACGVQPPPTATPTRTAIPTALPTASATSNVSGPSSPSGGSSPTDTSAPSIPATSTTAPVVVPTNTNPPPPPTATTAPPTATTAPPTATDVPATATTAPTNTAQPTNTVEASPTSDPSPTPGPSPTNSSG